MLETISTWDHNYIVLEVRFAGDYIVVCDAVSSLALLKLEDKRLLTVVKSYSPLWPLCMSVDNDNIIGANVSDLCICQARANFFNTAGQ